MFANILGVATDKMNPTGTLESLKSHVNLILLMYSKLLTTTFFDINFNLVVKLLNLNT